MKRLAFMFPGQGSQYVGMGRELYENYSIARETFEEASDLLGFDLKKACFEGTMQQLTKSELAQPAIVTVSTAAFRVFQQIYGLAALCSTGHSLGEISALVCSGAFEFSDAVKYVKLRGSLMDEAYNQKLGSMALVTGVDRYTLEGECRSLRVGSDFVGISCYNSSIQHLVSGHKEAVSKLGKTVVKNGGEFTPFGIVAMKVNAPFHSPLMSYTLDSLEKLLQQFTFSEMNWPVLSNVTALPYKGADQIVSNLLTQMVHPVRWRQSMKYLLEEGIETVIELGPQKVLKNLVKENTNYIHAISFDSKEDVEFFQKEWLEEKKRQPSIATKCLVLAISTKNNNRDNQAYQASIIDPMKRLKAMEQRIKTNEETLKNQDITELFHIIRLILAAKKVPVEEQRKQLQSLFGGYNCGLDYGFGEVI